jgi:hypothetical protein
MYMMQLGGVRAFIWCDSRLKIFKIAKVISIWIFGRVFRRAFCPTKDFHCWPVQTVLCHLTHWSFISHSILTLQTQLNSGFHIISIRSPWFTHLQSSKVSSSYTTCHFSSSPLYFSIVPFSLVSDGTIVWSRWVWMSLKSDPQSSSTTCKHRHLSSGAAKGRAQKKYKHIEQKPVLKGRKNDSKS